MSNPFTIDQDSYRWRNDDGSETTATYNKIANTGITVGDEAGTDFGFGVPIRLRQLYQETGGDRVARNPRGRSVAGHLALRAGQVGRLD